MSRIGKNVGVVIVVLIMAHSFMLNTSIAFAQNESGQVTSETATAGLPGKILNESAPSYIINKSSDYIKSFVGDDYYNRYITFSQSITYQSGTGETLYIVSYLYDIPLPLDYLARPHPRQISVSLDKDGNIMSYLGPKKAHTFSITREQAIEIAKQNGLKEPILAAVDRELASNSIDGYAWVVTGAVDKTTCRDIGGAQECLIPGRYVDVDNGSVIGAFNTSNLIQESQTNPVVNQQTSNNSNNIFKNSNKAYVVIAVLIVLLLLVIFFIKNRLKEKK